MFAVLCDCRIRNSWVVSSLELNNTKVKTQFSLGFNFGMIL